jgi:hypothetical protein
VVSSRVQRLGSLDFVSANTGNFRNASFPRNGSFINFGDHRVYVGTVPVRRYPSVVQVAADSPVVCVSHGRCTDRPANCVEVMMVDADGAAGKGAASDKDVATKSVRPANPAYERQQNHNGNASTSSVPPTPTLLQAAINKLATPSVATADLAMTQAELEAQRQHILQEDTEIACARQELDITDRKYNISHGFTPVNNEPSRVGDVRNRGRNLNKELNGDGISGVSMSTTYVSAGRPKYRTHAKNLRAAQAANEDLPML